jgi:hypothetical protein
MKNSSLVSVNAGVCNYSSCEDFYLSLDYSVDKKIYNLSQDAHCHYWDPLSPTCINYGVDMNKYEYILDLTCLHVKAQESFVASAE